MIIKQKFIYGTDNDYGNKGFKPVGMDFNYIENLGHDIIEHFPNQIDNIIGELEAIGSIIYIRYIGNYWYRFLPANVSSPENHIASDIQQVYRHYINVSSPIKNISKKRLSNYFTNQFDDSNFIDLVMKKIFTMVILLQMKMKEI
jgi:hypothetical protein